MSGLESVARMFFARAGAAIAVVVLVHGTGALAQSGSSSDVRSAAPPKIQPRPFLSAATAPLMTAGETGAGPSLQAFARAAHGVSGLRDKYMPRITAANIAERPERASDLFEEMRARMHDTIEAAGLTVENYEAMSARAQRDVDSAAAQREIGDLQRRLTQTETRLRQAQNRTVSGRAALQSQHTAELAVLRKLLAARPSEDALANSVEALAAADAEQARTAAERAALGREISHLSRSLQASLAALGEISTGLKAAEAVPARPFVRLTPKPSLFARTPTGLPRDLNAATAGAVLQARLDTEITRNLSLRAAQTAERVALGRGLARITGVCPGIRALVFGSAGDFMAGPRRLGFGRFSTPPEMGRFAQRASGYRRMADIYLSQRNKHELAKTGSIRCAQHFTTNWDPPMRF